MTEELPTPKSRKEEYLAKAAGMEDVALPEPASREELYLNAIAEGGGGGGGTSDFNELDNRPKYNGAAMTGETDIPLAPSVVQTTGTSQTDVMSQNAVTSMVFADPGTNHAVRIGNTATNGNNSVSIGYGGSADGVSSIQIGSSGASGAFSIAIGGSATNSDYSIAIGSSARVPSGSANRYSVALGAYARTTRGGEVNIGTGTDSYGYNSTSYRVLGGVHDGQNAHDAATVAQGNTLATSAPTTSTVGVLGQLYTDTTGMHTYQCTAISGDTYTWTQRW